MIKKITAIVTAAVCAGVMVTLVPGFAPDVAAGASQPVDQSVPTVARVDQLITVTTPSAADTRNVLDQNIRNDSRERNACAQGWPYYDQSCLSDSRQAYGKPGAVRIIAIDRSAAIQTQR